MGALGIVAVALVGGLQLLLSLRRPPQWEKFPILAPRWSLINWLAYGVSLAAATLAFLLYSSHEYIASYVAIASGAAGLLAFVVVQTFYTDFKARRADRRVLRLANLTALAGGLWFLLTHSSESEVITYLIFTAVATSIIFLPAIGDSDGRAFQLLVLAGFPVFSIEGLTPALLLFLAGVTVFGVTEALRAGKFNFSFLTSKVSIPAVPLILTPGLAVLLVWPFV